MIEHYWGTSVVQGGPAFRASPVGSWLSRGQSQKPQVSYLSGTDRVGVSVCKAASDRVSFFAAQAISGWPDTAMEKAIQVLQRLRALGNAMLQFAYSQRHQLEKWYGLILAICPCIHGLPNKITPPALAVYAQQSSLHTAGM